MRFLWNARFGAGLTVGVVEMFSLEVTNPDGPRRSFVVENDFSDQALGSNLKVLRVACQGLQQQFARTRTPAALRVGFAAVLMNGRSSAANGERDQDDSFGAVGLSRRVVGIENLVALTAQ